MSQSEFDYLCKVVIIGDSGTGKSSLLVKFADDEFNNVFLSTIGVDFKIRTIQMDNIVVKLQIWDTGGSERFRSIINSYYRDANIVIMVYDITNPYTLYNIPAWKHDAEIYNGSNNVGTGFILVGSKND